jgi:hypothetical protein
MSTLYSETPVKNQVVFLPKKADKSPGMVDTDITVVKYQSFVINVKNPGELR